MEIGGLGRIHRRHQTPLCSTRRPSEVPETGARLTPPELGTQSLDDEPWDPTTDVKVPEHCLLYAKSLYSKTHFNLLLFSINSRSVPLNFIIGCVYSVLHILSIPFAEFQ